MSLHRLLIIYANVAWPKDSKQVWHVGCWVYQACHEQNGSAADRPCSQKNCIGRIMCSIARQKATSNVNATRLQLRVVSSGYILTCCSCFCCYFAVMLPCTVNCHCWFI